MIWRLLTVLLLPTLVFAQFGSFFQGGFPFGQHPFHQQEHESGHAPRQHKGWSEMDSVHCRAGYVCPASLACVPTPADCPCPYPEDIKCVIPDHRDRDEGEGPPFVCVRGHGASACEDVNSFSKPI